MVTKIKVEIDVDKRLSEMEHFVCCHDHTKTICGLTIPADENCDWSNEVECPACMAISHMFENDDCYCPIDGYCTHALNTCSCPPDED